jgi:hypothetical protein
MNDEAKQERERDELDKAFRAIIKTPEGKRVLFWMLEQCAIYQDAFSADHTNATNYMLGRQNAGRRLIEKLDQLDPRFYPQLLLDIADLRAMDQAAASRAANSGEDDEE